MNESRSYDYAGRFRVVSDPEYMTQCECVPELCTHAETNGYRFETVWMVLDLAAGEEHAHVTVRDFDFEPFYERKRDAVRAVRRYLESHGIQIRLAAVLRSDLDGSQIVQEARAGVAHADRYPYSPRPLEELAAFRLADKLVAARPAADGSVTIHVDRAEALVLVEQVETFEVASGDNVGPDDPAALATVNACRATLRRLRAFLDGVEGKGAGQE